MMRIPISCVFFFCPSSDVRNGAKLEPRVIAKAPEGQGCPRCGGFVYAAEQMLARGRVSIYWCEVRCAFLRVCVWINIDQSATLQYIPVRAGLSQAMFQVLAVQSHARLDHAL